MQDPAGEAIKEQLRSATEQALKDEKVKPESLAKANDPRFSNISSRSES